MRAVIQRVKRAKVIVENNVIGEIENGFMVLLGVGKDDSEKDIIYLKEKIVNLRIFNDEDGRMNRSIIDVKGEILIVSQFTLYADVRKGKRPGFSDAADPKTANELYEKFIFEMRETGIKIETGKFGADMDVDFVNWGPVTLLLDSKKHF